MDILTPHVGLIFWQTIILVTAYIILKKFAWKPILSYIEQQEKEHAQALKQEAAARKNVHKLQLMGDKLVEKANQKKEKIIQKAQATQKALITEAKLKGEEAYSAMLEKARQDLKKEEKLALQALTNKVGQLAADAARKIMQRELEHKHVQQVVLGKLLEKAQIEKA